MAWCGLLVWALVWVVSVGCWCGLLVRFVSRLCGYPRAWEDGSSHVLSSGDILGVVWCGVVWCGVVWCGVVCLIRNCLNL